MGVSVSSVCWSILAILPTSVSIPVETTTPRPLPYVTIPLEKAILIRSPRAGSVTVRGSVILSTGTDSPVRADSCIFRLTASVSRISAGITAPVSSITTSPGTISFVGTSIITPSRSTFVRGAARLLRASSEVSAFLSWNAPTKALSIRMPIITKVSRRPSPSITPTTPDMAAAISSMIIIKLLNCPKNMAAKLFLRFDSS